MTEFGLYFPSDINCTGITNYKKGTVLQAKMRGDLKRAITHAVEAYREWLDASCARGDTLLTMDVEMLDQLAQRLKYTTIVFHAVMRLVIDGTSELFLGPHLELLLQINSACKKACRNYASVVIKEGMIDARTVVPAMIGFMAISTDIEDELYHIAWSNLAQ